MYSYINTIIYVKDDCKLNCIYENEVYNFFSKLVLKYKCQNSMEQ